MAAILPFVQVAGAVLSGVTMIAKANAEARTNRSKAYEAQMQARTDALAYKKEAIEKLKELRATLASNVARGSAGGLDPFAAGETIDLLNLNNLTEGAKDWRVAQSNAELAILSGNRQSQIYLDAAGSGSAIGAIGGVVEIGAGLGQYYEDTSTS